MVGAVSSRVRGLVTGAVSAAAPALVSVVVSGPGVVPVWSGVVALGVARPDLCCCCVLASGRRATSSRPPPLPIEPPPTQVAGRQCHHRRSRRRVAAVAATAPSAIRRRGALGGRAGGRRGPGRPCPARARVRVAAAADRRGRRDGLAWTRGAPAERRLVARPCARDPLGRPVQQLADQRHDDRGHRRGDPCAGDPELRGDGGRRGGRGARDRERPHVEAALLLALG